MYSLNSICTLNGTHWIYLFLCLCACFYRGSLLCGAWHHDNKVRWWVPIPDGELWIHSRLPLLLDNNPNTKALITGHHCPQLWRICLNAFLPRVHPACDCQQKPCCCLHLYVRIKCYLKNNTNIQTLLIIQCKE